MQGCASVSALTIISSQSCLLTEDGEFVADSDEVSAAEFDNAFVAMQYYGYLRRKPEPAGYEAWLRVLRSGDARTMVNGFVNSQEHQLRFGRP